ncbi:Lrp/AsnC family transcriptional regulator [bacterium AH-315-K03]|nr:Lrp/AsnC family transcriptional regulator [bacterium AH-315-K03]
MDPKDKELLALLRANGRETTAELARKLKLSRSTVKDRIERLQKRNIITGFTVRFSEQYAEGQIQAHVMISSDPKKTAQITRVLRQMPTLISLYAVNGVYDMIAIISTDSTHALDQTLDKIGQISGIEKTVSSIILSTKFER